MPCASAEDSMNYSTEEESVVAKYRHAGRWLQLVKYLYATQQKRQRLIGRLMAWQVVILFNWLLTASVKMRQEQI